MTDVPPSKPPQENLPFKDRGKYLLRDERVRVFEHQHWAVLGWEITAVVGATLFVVWVDAATPPSADGVVKVLWFLWLCVLGWAAWKFAEWRRDWFIATNKRLLWFYGIPRRVAMMPMIKVTDMTYQRTVPGLIFRYGRYIMESAGQDQALSTINFVPHPDENYKEICDVLFGEQMGVVRQETPPEDEGPPDSNGPRPGRGPREPDNPYSPRRHHDRWVTEDAPHAIPTGRRSGQESLYQSPDIVRRHRSADTGPIPIYPPPGADD